VIVIVGSFLIVSSFRVISHVWRFVLIAEFEDAEEGFLWDFDATHALHALFAFLLLFQQFALARDVAAVAFGRFCWQ
jgi:hypothetical protein